jgi:hypothetical protein
LNFDGTPFRELHRRGCLDDEPLVGQILARRCDSADIQVLLEMALDLGARPRFTDLAKMIDHRPEQRRGALRQVAIDRLQRRLNVLPCFLAVEKVGVDRLEKRRIQLHRLWNHLPVGEQSPVDDLDLR